MAKHIGILVAPDGEEFYDAYGPMTKLRDRATRFASAEVAALAANNRFGRRDDAFWNSERIARDNAAREHRGWTSRTEEVAGDDAKREGHFVLSYVEGAGDRERLYAHENAGGGIEWRDELGGCLLWPDRNDAVAAIRTMDQPEGRRLAVDTY